MLLYRVPFFIPTRIVGLQISKTAKKKEETVYEILDGTDGSIQVDPNNRSCNNENNNYYFEYCFIRRK